MKLHLYILILVLIFNDRLVVAQKPNGATMPATVSKIPQTFTGYTGLTDMPVNKIRTWVPKRPLTLPIQVIDEKRTTKEVQLVTQYIDGMGRDLQQVTRGQSPDGKDIVQPAVYEETGKEVFKLMAYVAGSNNGSFQEDPYTDQVSFLKGIHNPADNTDGEKFFYGEVSYENSPLNRVTKATPPGNSWTGSSRGTATQYELNTINEVVQWVITDVENAVPSAIGYYGAGQLFRSITVDEQGKQVVLYKNKNDQVILKKMQLTGSDKTSHAGWLCTYYIYDKFNQLRFVIPPNAVDAIAGNSWNLGFNINVVPELCYSYYYDERGRMLSKKVPGAAAVYMVYDILDRMVMTQDGNLRNKGKWMVIKYDAFGRSKQTFVWNNTQSRSTHITQATTASYPILSGSYTLLSETYYDDYAWVSGTPVPSTMDGGEVTGDFASSSVSIAPYPETPEANYEVRGEVTGSKVNILGTTNYLYTVNFYDSKGRVVQVQSSNNGGGKDIVTTQYSFDGRVLHVRRSHSADDFTTQQVAIFSSNKYDNSSRLTQVDKTVNGSPVITIAKNSYDELGQLQSKEIGKQRAADGKYTSTPLETFNYTYNIRGWLKGINENYTASGGTGSYFGMQLCYDYGFANANYSGNIAGMIWKTKGSGEQQRAYSYKYDVADRLLSATYTEYSSSGSDWNQSGGVNYNVLMGDGTTPASAYDANGNILRMQQWGLKYNGSQQIDDLAYTYNDYSNKLQNVADKFNDASTILGDFRTASTSANYSSKQAYAANPGSVNLASITDYTYDDNGNLSSDDNKSISAIEYNLLNLPSLVTTAKGTIAYLYNANGVKLEKTVTDNSVLPAVLKHTYYVGGFVYEKSGAGASELQYIMQEEGRIRVITPRGDYDLNIPGLTNTGSIAFADISKAGVVDYFVKDHLGNVRVVLTDELHKERHACTMEDADPTRKGYEEGNFGQVNSAGAPAGSNEVINTRDNAPPGWNSRYSDPSNSRVSKVGGPGNANKVGPNMLLKVMAGDQLDLKVDYYYQNLELAPSGSNLLSNVVNSLLGAIGSSSAVSGDLHSVAGSSALQSALGNPSGALNSFLQDQNPTGLSAPQAYLSWIFFDENFKPVKGGGSKRVENAGDLQDPLIPHVDVPQNGFVYIYVSNESLNQAVYFDDLTVVHNRGPLTEESHYYPFGLVMQGISSKAANKTPNKNGHIGKEMQSKEFSDGSGLEQYDFGARFYDPQIGRWHVKDPLAGDYSSYSPYSYCFNNPIILVDLNGMSAENYQNVFEEVLNMLNSMKDGEIAHYQHNADGSWDKGTFTTNNGKEAEGTIVIVGGNDFGSNGGLSETTKALAGALSSFFSDHKSKINIKAFSADLAASTMIPIVDYVKNNHNTATPLFFYGYSLGGHTANQAIKILNTDHIKVNLFFAVDAALGFASRRMEVSSNVERLINIYQTDCSLIGSRGYPASAIPGNNVTRITNINYDDMKSVKGMGAHGAIDEDTYESVLMTFKNQMLLLIGK